MEEINDKYKDEFKFNEEESYCRNFKIYTSRYYMLKVISKEILKAQDYIFLQERLKKEQELQTLCSDYICDEFTNTVVFKGRSETKNNIILELQSCGGNLYEYLQEKGNLSDAPYIFARIVEDISNGLKIIYDNGIIHRDIKPHNIYHYFMEAHQHVVFKIGNFSCATKIKENPSDSIGTILYNAPEMVKDLEYDEKVDLWSLGITLFELYFGVTPYGPDADINSIMNIIYDDNFVLKKHLKKKRNLKFLLLIYYLKDY